MKKRLFVISGILFGLMSLLHLFRIFCRFEAQIGSLFIPHWVSYLAFPIFGLLSILNWRAALKE